MSEQLHIQKNFSFSQATKFGFSKWRAHFWDYLKIQMALGLTLVGVTILLGLLIFIVHYLAGDKVVSPYYNDRAMPIFGGLVILFLILFVLALSLFGIFQITRLSLLIYENRVDEWKGPLEFQPRMFWNYLFAKLWFYIKCFFGLLLFWVPGIYISTKYWFTGIPLIDGTAHTVGEDVKYNRAVTRTILPKLFFTVLFLSFITSLLNTFLLSIIFYPIIDLTAVHIYKQLEQFLANAHKTI